MRFLCPECCPHLNLHHGAPASTSPEGHWDAERTSKARGALRRAKVVVGGCTGGFNHGQVITETKITTGHFEV